ncbi:MAG TPA: hypothetical protein VJ695_06445 [Nitrososphaera sp.]|nr:hypothetical protein [Nitrososphaera sp.]
MVATKPAILMLMIGSISCGIIAIFLSLLIGMSPIIALPGLVIGAFFAFRYFRYNRTEAPSEAQEEEDQKRKTKRRNL